MRLKRQPTDGCVEHVLSCTYVETHLSRLAGNRHSLSQLTAPQAALGRRPDGVTLGHSGGAVAALAWVTADPALLGIAVAHGTFLIWDTAGGGPIIP